MKGKHGERRDSGTGDRAKGGPAQVRTYPEARGSERGGNSWLSTSRYCANCSPTAGASQPNRGVHSVLPDLGRVTNAVQAEWKSFRNLAKSLAVDVAVRTDQRNVKFVRVGS